ncbi:MAG: hypothetical protein RL662_1043 [Bacteroidota bacterium]
MRKLVLSFMLCSASATLLCQTMPKYKNPNLSFEERAVDLVSKMTLEEKVAQMVYTAPAIDRLEIPAHNWWNECLHGVARAGLATVFPQAIGMAAMWDKQQMGTNAQMISDEARAKHHEFASRNKRGIYQGLTYWTPNINIFRDPRWGRGMETYGEDPYLAGELAIPFIKGLQGDDSKYLKLVATAKHFVVHSGPESERHSFDVNASTYDFLNTYSPHFKKVVEKSNVHSVMCAYNSVNGLPCCGNLALSDLLRKKWGFDGYIVSDCWAIVDFYNKGAHEVVSTREEAAAMAVKAGTDLNCGSTYPALVESVKQGLINEKELDVSIERLMVARMKLGLFAPAGAVKYEAIPYSVVDSEKHRLAALESARKSIVLLKNQNNLLPLSKDIKNIAVIGSNADDLEVLLGNYNGYPSAPKTPLMGLKEKLPNANIMYAAGCKLANGLPIFESMPAHVLYVDSKLTEKGLKAQYFDNIDLSGLPKHTRVDSKIDFIWRTSAPFNDMSYDKFSARWEGYIAVDESGEYALGGEAFSGIRLWLDDKLLIERSDEHHPRKEYEYVKLEAKKAYKIKLEYVQNNTEYAIMRLLWERPNQNLLQDAIEIAKKADLVIYFMGISPLLEGEEMKVKVDGFMGGDRLNMNLPATQTQLMQEIQKLNKPSVLVLLNGSALSINWEAENIPAIVEAWYPGQGGGTAIADVVFGDYNPAGRLPITFYKSIDDIPPFKEYDMRGKTYRYFKGKPLYEFGYGLSYTSFTYSNMRVDKTAKTGQKVKVSVDVTNTGSKDGHEVVEAYVAIPSAGVYNPHINLAGFDRVFLKVGETKNVQFEIEPEQLAVVNNKGIQLVNPTGAYIYVGGSLPNEEKVRSKQVLKHELRMLGSAFVLN